MEDKKQLDFGSKFGKYTVSFPNVGQFMEIQNLRMALTNNNYPQMCLSITKEAILNLDLIDAISTFAVLIPDLRKQFDIKNYQDLDMRIAKVLRDVYINEYFVWYDEIYKDIYTEKDVQDDKLLKAQTTEDDRRDADKQK